MRKPLALFVLVGVVAITSGCSKEKLHKYTESPKYIAGAVVAGLAAGAHYFRDTFGLKKHIGMCRKRDHKDETVANVEEATTVVTEEAKVA